MKHFIYPFVLVTFYFFSSAATSQLAEYEICNQDHVKCLEILPATYEKIDKHSAAWFRLKNFELDAYFYLERFEPLLAATSELVKLQNTPQEFQFALAIYHAKALFAQDSNSAIGFEYVNKAKAIYQQRHAIYVAPRRMIFYANLLLEEADKIRQQVSKQEHMATLREAYHVLNQVKKDYMHLSAPDFQIDLYSNLYQVSTRIENHTKAIYYQKKAVFWAKQQSNKRTIGVVIYNLARAYHNLGQQQKAVDIFNESLVYFKQAKDEVSIIDCHLRLAESYKELGQFEKVQRNMEIVDTLSLSLPLNKWQLKLKSEIVN